MYYYVRITTKNSITYQYWNHTVYMDYMNSPHKLCYVVDVISYMVR